MYFSRVMVSFTVALCENPAVPLGGSKLVLHYYGNKYPEIQANPGLGICGTILTKTSALLSYFCNYE